MAGTICGGALRLDAFDLAASTGFALPPVMIYGDDHRDCPEKFDALEGVRVAWATA